MLTRDKMKLRAFLSALVAVVAVAWFGLRLGPQQKEQRPASPVTAVLAAQGFVRSAVAKRASEVTFPANGVLASPNAADPTLWMVSGTARATIKGGTTALQWTVREHWDGSHNWRLKAVEVLGPKRAD